MATQSNARGVWRDRWPLVHTSGPVGHMKHSGVILFTVGNLWSGRDTIRTGQPLSFAYHSRRPPVVEYDSLLSLLNAQHDAVPYTVESFSQALAGLIHWSSLPQRCLCVQLNGASYQRRGISQPDYCKPSKLQSILVYCLFKIIEWINGF